MDIVMKTILILSVIVTFASSQRQVGVKSQTKFEDSEEISYYNNDYKSSPEFRQPISNIPQSSAKKPNIEGNRSYARKLPTEHSSQIDVEPDHERPRSSDRKPKNIEGEAEILKYTNENNGFEGYQFGYETSNGISRNEQLTFRDIDEENRVADIQGGYEFVDPLGRRVVVTYTAGVEGFKPIIHYF